MMTEARRVKQMRQLREELERCELRLCELQAERSANETLGDLADQAEVTDAMRPWLRAQYEAQRGTLREAICLCESGRYGICAICAHAIEWGRLKAIPSARLCITCQQASDRRSAAVPKSAHRTCTHRRKAWTP
jgi:DnaK suppressor protein